MIRSVSNLRRFAVGAVVAGALLVAAPTAAFASTHVATHKPGSSCTKVEVGKTSKSGKNTLVCTAVEVYRWEKKK